VEDAIPENFKHARLLEKRLNDGVLGSPHADMTTISFWMDEILLIKKLTLLSSRLKDVPLEQKST